MEDMGMTDKQFNGFVRFILDDLKEIKEEKESEKREEKLDKIIENLQKTLEDKKLYLINKQSQTQKTGGTCHHQYQDKMYHTFWKKARVKR